MRNELPLLLERINSLVDGEARKPAPQLLERMEHTLTDGYAYALALEAESIRLSRDIGVLVRRLKRGEDDGELRLLAMRLDSAEQELHQLRTLLGMLRHRTEGVRREISQAA